MSNYEFFLASSLEKVFPDCRPEPLPNGSRLSVLAGQRGGVQLVYCRTEGSDTSLPTQLFDIRIASGPDCPVRMRSVELLPSDYPCYEVNDDNYITKTPGLFPDLLKPVENAVVRPLPRQYRSLWLDWQIPEGMAPGTYPVEIIAQGRRSVEIPNGTVQDFSEQQSPTFRFQFSLRVLAAKKPEQKLIHTQWFHADCLANYYQVPVFSEEYWQITENFIRAAGQEHSINMLLTPVFTPPLDTAVGHERLTVQLVDITRTGDTYTFGFDQLKRWVSLCKTYGIRYLEIAHFFTQWGALATPKIMATVEGKLQRIFGWDVPATSPEYRNFLQQFVPALQKELANLGYDREHVYYHISDEPHTDHLSDYLAAKKQVIDLLEGCPVIDALSSLDFYSQGVVEQPIPANDHIQPFIDANVPDLWVYYCCAQCKDVPNRFYAMPSARNRIMGVLLYLYRIKGFLHWGYNFYNGQYSLNTVDPYRITHCNYAFPSGDPYLVYPGPQGQPLSSIRAEVQSDALSDLACFELLEQLAGREAVEKLIYEGVEDTITFTQYPTSADYLLALREKVADAIHAHL